MKITPVQNRLLGGFAKAATANLEPLNGSVLSVDAAGIVTVDVDGCGAVQLPNASGRELSVNDQVSIRIVGKSFSKAEISGKTAQMPPDTNTLTVWR